MTSQTRVYPLTATLLLTVAVAGCKMTDRPSLFPERPIAQYDSLLDDTSTVIQASLDRNPADSKSLDSTQPHVIRTLKDGEDLQTLVDAAPGVVLLDFYADWCEPCKNQSKVLHQLEGFASEVNAQIIKVNVEEHRSVAKRYQVSSLPTLVAVRDGAAVERKVGFTKPDRLKAMLR